MMKELDLKEKLPRGTITLPLVLSITLIYIGLAYKYLFIPNTHLLAYGFSPSNPVGALTYSFLHLSPQHLLANATLLLAMGIIVEKKLRPQDYLAIFLASAVTAGITFHVLTPEPTVLVGASSAVSGILAAAVFVDFKKAIAAIILFGVFIHIASPAVINYTEFKLNSLQSQTSELQEQYSEVKKKVNETEQELKNLSQKISELQYQCFELNDSTACEKLKTLNESKQAAEEEKKDLEEQENETFQTLNKTATEERHLQQGITREEKAKTSAIVHLVGAMTGIGYLLAFRRDILWSLPSQASQLENYFQK